MALKDLFSNKNNTKSIVKKTLADFSKDVESEKYITEYKVQRDAVIPQVDLSDPSAYVKFGSAEKYNQDCIDWIIDYYPYDGSGYEKILWHNSSSYYDLHIFNNEYPRTNGYVTLNVDGVNPTPTIGDYFSSSGEYVLLPGALVVDNIIDSNRGNNLKLDIRDSGNTIEFWMKHHESSVSNNQVVFDIWNGKVEGAADYGRLRIEIENANNKFQITCLSGSSGFSNHILTGGKPKHNTWSHYSFTLTSSTTETTLKFYQNGILEETHTTTSIGNIDTLEASSSLGSLISSPEGAPYTGEEMLGYGLLSASLDEFRFWTEGRDSREIKRNLWTQVDGGTNLDNSNYPLTVYYKFNEGIAGSNSIDKNIIDYSGRKMHATWNGYPGSSSRATGSAMVLAGVADAEFKDPILRRANPLVSALIEDKRQEGSEFDQQNAASIYNSYPAWITEEDEETQGQLKNLTQIIASYFDKLQSQIDGVLTLKDVSYNRDVEDADGEYLKPFPFSNRLVESLSFPVENLFSEMTTEEDFKSRDDDRNYRDKIHDIKNSIYKNIYNNLPYIYKTKGTEKSLRSFLNSVGIDHELARLNVYSNNQVLDFKNRYSLNLEKKRYAAFSEKENRNATVYQERNIFLDSLSSDIENYVSGSEQLSRTGLTFQVEAIFPNINEDTHRIFDLPLSCSIGGSHTPFDTSDYDDDRWAVNDTGSIQLYAVRDQSSVNKRAKFVLTSSHGIFDPIVTDYYENVFNDSRWNFSVKIKPTKTIQSFAGEDSYHGSNPDTYTLELFVANSLTEDYYVTGSHSVVLTQTNGENYIESPKRYFIGAHRQNFTGSVLQQSCADITSLRVWTVYLEDDVCLDHARSAVNYGISDPLGDTSFYDRGGEESISGFHVMSGSLHNRVRNLSLNWEMKKHPLPGLGDDNFYIIDMSSGSYDIGSDLLDISEISTRHYYGVGYGFGSENDIEIKQVQSLTRKQPEVLDSQDMITVIEGSELETFGGDLQAVDYYVSLEKSMYQNISDEMLNMLSTIKDFNNLVGEPIEKYRGRYKKLEKLRSIFFEKVQSDIDFEKFLEFYKWIDSFIHKAVEQLIPASAKTSNKISNIVESHVFERNKYRHKLPTLEFKMETPEGAMHNIRAPFLGEPERQSPAPQYKNQLWWKYRAERTNPTLTSGDSIVDAARDALHKTTVDEYDRGQFRASEFKFQIKDEYDSGINSPQSKIRDFYLGNYYDNPISIPASKISRVVDTEDDFELKKKERLNFHLYSDTISGSGEKLAPFSLFSSSVAGGYKSSADYIAFSNAIPNRTPIRPDIFGHHDDSYGPNYEKPLQGPFTETHVGKMPHRSNFVSDGTQSEADERVESFDLQVNSSGITIDTSPLAQRSHLRPIDFVKRSVNIRNIKQTIDSKFLGNYQNDYEVFQTSNRRMNNLWFRDTDGGTTENYGLNFEKDSFRANDLAASAFVGGLQEYKKPVRHVGKNVFVERFSSPGGPETMGDTDGGPGLDALSAEYSVYNSMNYRNLKVRRLVDQTEKQHMGPGGHSTFTPHTASWYTNTPVLARHRINPNAKLKIIQTDVGLVTGSLYNNVSYTTPIPAQDYGYSWITASLSGSRKVETQSIDEQPYGLLRIENIPAGYYVATSFVYTYGTAPPGFVSEYIDFIGLNSIVSDEITTDSDGFPVDNLLGDDSPDFSSNGDYSYQGGLVYTKDNDFQINDLILHRQGPYGWPTWKQIRIGEGPISRYNKRRNIYSVTRKEQDREGDIITYKNRNLNYKEPMITNKYRPLKHDVILPVHKNDGTVASQNYTIEHSYGNNKGRFANTDLTKNAFSDGRETTNTEEMYSKLLDLYEDGGFEFNTLSYREVIFPREVNTYLKRTRQRDNFIYSHIWNDDRSKRSIGGNSSFGDSVISQSVWPIDGRKDYTVETTRENIFDGSGELQSACVTFYSQSATELIDGPLYARRNVGRPAISASFVSPLYSYLLSGSVTAFPYIKITARTSTVRNDGTEHNIYYIPQSSSLWSSQSGDDYYFGVAGWDTGQTDLSIAFPSDPDVFYNKLTGLMIDHIPVDFIGVNEDDGGWSHVGSYSSAPTTTSSIVSFDGYGMEFSITQYSGTFTSGGLDHDLWLFDSTSSNPSETIFTTPTNSWVLGGDAEWTANTQSGRQPYYTSYETYAEHMRVHGKEFGIVPEFRMSEHIENYLTSSTIDFLKNKDDTYTITGSTKNSSDSSFFKEYSTTDFLKHFDVVYSDHEKLNKNLEDDDKFSLNKVVLTCKAYKRFLPYDGLYPARRTQQIVQDFSSSYGGCFGERNTVADFEADFITRDYQGDLDPTHLRQIIAPLFAPGLLYNSIKSGIAVDFPVYTGSYGSYANQLTASFDKRMPFQTLLSPDEKFGRDYYQDLEPVSGSTIDQSIQTNGSRANFIRFKKTSNNSLYQVSMNNFLAEVSRFFLEEGKNNFLSSKPITSVTPANKSRYQMRITLDKDVEMNMYSRPSAFGPPCNLKFENTASPGNGLGRMTGFFPDGLSYSSTGSFYTPFTPPYYDGESSVLITFPANGLDLENKPYTLEEIKSLSQYEFFRSIPNRTGSLETSITSNTSGLAKTDVMHVDASLEFDKIQTLDEETGLQSWTISSIFESPVLNFDQTQTGLFYSGETAPTTGVAPSAKGMWHQYGTATEESSIKVRLSDPDVDLLTSPTGSLKTLLGFEQDHFKIGQTVKNYREVKEAIVAIPFKKEDDGEKYFFKIEKTAIDFILKMRELGVDPEEYYNIVNSGNEADSNISSEALGVLRSNVPTEGVPHPSINKMVSALQDFVFPPTFDFLKFAEQVDPVVMFVFEFKHRFTAKDITNIWQNVLPENIDTFGPNDELENNPVSTTAASMEHLALAESFFNIKEKDKVRWMVFKVKQRARTKYSESAPYVSDLVDPPEEVKGYSHNWPYDYFSIVELASMEAECVFGKEPRTFETPQTVTFDPADIREPEEIIEENMANVTSMAPSPGSLAGAFDSGGDNTPEEEVRVVPPSATKEIKTLGEIKSKPPNLTGRFK